MQADGAGRDGAGSTAQANGTGRRHRPTAAADGARRRSSPTELADGARRRGRPTAEADGVRRQSRPTADTNRGCRRQQLCTLDSQIWGCKCTTFAAQAVPVLDRIGLTWQRQHLIQGCDRRLAWAGSARCGQSVKCWLSGTLLCFNIHNNT